MGTNQTDNNNNWGPTSLTVMILATKQTDSAHNWRLTNQSTINGNQGLKPATHDRSLSANNVGPGVRDADNVRCQNDDRHWRVVCRGLVLW